MRYAVKRPPKKRLTERQVADLKEWIARGAPMPEDDAKIAALPVRKEFQVTEKDREYWAFKPVRRPGTLAMIQDASWERAG